MAGRAGDVVEVAYSKSLASAAEVHGWCVDEQSARMRCAVPAGHVFVLSDNEDAGVDSRYLGPLPRRSVKGRLGPTPLRLPPVPATQTASPGHSRA